MITIILIEPENDGNVGAIARVMKNFDFKDLILINPKCNHLSKEALSRAKHGKDLLKNAKIKSIGGLRTFDYLIATTAVLGTNYNIPRSPITPEELSDKLNKTNIKKLKIGLIIGREGIGLKNEEIQKCDFIVTIPTSKKYPTINISHAVSIILYEIFKKQKKEKINQHIKYASKKEKEVILDYIKKILDKMDFATKEKKETQIKVWKRIIGKSFLTKREAFAIMGFLRKIK